MGKRGIPTKYANLHNPSSYLIRQSTVEKLRAIASERQVSLAEQFRDAIVVFGREFERFGPWGLYNSDWAYEQGESLLNVYTQFNDELEGYISLARGERYPKVWVIRYALEWYLGQRVDSD